MHSRVRAFVRSVVLLPTVYFALELLLRRLLCSARIILRSDRLAKMRNSTAEQLALPAAECLTDGPESVRKKVA